MSNVYVEKMEFHELLLQYFKELALDDTKRITENIGKRFKMIAYRYLTCPEFFVFSKKQKDEMASEAYYDMCRYIKNYDAFRMQEEYENSGCKKIPDPFSYFTTYAYNGIMRWIKENDKDKKFLIKVPFIENMD